VAAKVETDAFARGLGVFAGLGVLGALCRAEDPDLARDGAVVGVEQQMRGVLARGLRQAVRRRAVEEGSDQGGSFVSRSRSSL
jgi:hypothetical protein